MITSVLIPLEDLLSERAPMRDGIELIPILASGIMGDIVGADPATTVSNIKVNSLEVILSENEAIGPLLFAEDLFSDNQVG